MKKLFVFYRLLGAVDDALFGGKNSKVTQFQQKHYPVISVDTKKKELTGNFKNNG